MKKKSIIRTVSAAVVGVATYITLALPANNWEVQNLKIEPTTHWTSSFNAQYNKTFYGLACYSVIRFDLPVGATSFKVNLVRSRLCGEFESTNITYHGGECGMVSSPSNLLSPPAFCNYYASPGDSVYGTISIFGVNNQVSYSKPFKFLQPLGDNPDPAYKVLCQQPGCMESDSCKNIVNIRLAMSQK